MNLTDIREGLAEALKPVSNRVHPYTPEQVNPPCAFIGSPSGLYSRDYDGDVTVTLPVWVIVGASDMTRGQEALDPFIATAGARSVVVAVHADPHLGGRVHDTRVLGWQEPGLVEVGAGSFIGVRFDVEVFA